MQRTNLHRLIISALGMVALTAQAQPDYRATQLPDAEPGKSLTFVDVNDRGEIVGHVEGNVYVWRNHRYVRLNDRITSTSSYVSVSGIDNRSRVVGQYYDDAQQVWQPYVLRGPRVRLIPPVDGDLISVNDINDAGQIVGQNFTGALILDRGKVTYLNGADGTARNTDPNAINRQGTVVGTDYSRYRQDEFDGAFGSIAAVWVDGRYIPTTGAPNALSSWGVDINDHGEIVGYSQVASDRPPPEDTAAPQPRDTVAFVWRRDEVTQLPFVSSTQNRALPAAINDEGDVVGTTSVEYAQQTATLWHRRVAYDLNRLVRKGDLPQGTHLDTALAINDAGQIIVTASTANGRRDVLVILNPTRRRH